MAADSEHRDSVLDSDQTNTVLSDMHRLDDFRLRVILLRIRDDSSKIRVQTILALGPV